MYNPNQINNISEIKQPYSFSDIECLYHTGRSIYISGSGRNKVTTYRSGVATNIGDIVSDVWIEAMEHLIKESNEEVFIMHSKSIARIPVLGYILKKSCTCIHWNYILLVFLRIKIG